MVNKVRILKKPGLQIPRIKQFTCKA